MISLAVIEDHDLFREGLLRALAAEEGIQVIFAGASAEALVDRRTPRCDVALVDLHLAGEAESPIRDLASRRIAVLAMSAAASTVEVLSAIQVGARGFVAKEASSAETVRAVRTLAGGGVYVSPTTASLLLPGASSPERAVLVLIARGERERDVADQLGLDAGAVCDQLERAFARVVASEACNPG